MDSQSRGTHFKSSGGYHWAAQHKVSWSHSPKPSSHSNVQSRRKAWSTPAESPARSVTCPHPTQRYRPPAPPQALIKAPEFHKEKTRKEARNPTTGIIIEMLQTQSQETLRLGKRVLRYQTLNKCHKQLKSKSEIWRTCLEK